ncbi:MAG: hypothetical protein OXI16_09160 [Chloroflexota bacterium]|nr:hypothetical protein [Chloroflexota bacterium]
MTAERDRFASGGRKPRTKEEIEKLLQSPQFHSKMMDGFAQIERGEYVSYPIYEIRRRLRLDE